ncbi:MAG: 1,4-dihydroxy-2-naphthoate polyprenyltransferase [Rhabdochlamydiaceae bacterium]|nr:1,4-dihydroxy-2-naphthoate polyprenyltransferase [Rhabdochlamydiaceae bacterium]
MNRVKVWTLAARPKTWISSFSPVLIGSTLAISDGVFNLASFIFTLATALAIQIGANLANDYFDFIKGADTIERKGPQRMTQSGLVTPQAMKRAMILTFLIALLSGCYLIFKGGSVIALLLSFSILFGILYTGGPFPLAYLGLGEVFAFTFFGPIATAGTYYMQTLTWSKQAFLAGIAPGALCTAILILNNVRDINEDKKANKKTLAVRFGKTFGQIEYIAVILGALVPLIAFYPTHPFSLLGLLILLPALPLLQTILKPCEPQTLNLLFGKTGQLMWLYTLLFCIGWML